jgi:hypothetical protein
VNGFNASFVCVGISWQHSVSRLGARRELAVALLTILVVAPTDQTKVLWK